MSEIHLYNEDCLKVMDNFLSENKKVDCIICDPPYRVTSRGGKTNTGGMLKKALTKKGFIYSYNECTVQEWSKRIYCLLKDGGHCYIMTNHMNLTEYLNVLTQAGFKFIKCLIWDKGNKILGQYYMSQYEYILFLRKGKGVPINNCGDSDIIRIPNKKHKDKNGNNWHDTEKPVGLTDVLIKNSTQKGETVLDFCMGIGGCGCSAKRLGRSFIGIEIDKKYYDVAKARIDAVS